MQNQGVAALLGVFLILFRRNKTKGGTHMISKKSLITLTLSFLLLGASISFADQALVQKLSDSVRGNMRISHHSETGKVRFIGAPPSSSLPQPSAIAPDALPENAARNFLNVYGRLFGISDPERELVLYKAKQTPGARHVTKFEQVYKGLPVIAGELIVNMDRAKNIKSINGEVSPNIDLDITPLIDAASAEDKALVRVSKKYMIPESSLEASPAELSIYNPVLLGDRMNKNFLVWKIIVRAYNSPVKEFVLIDAKSGVGLLSFNQIHSALNRSIYDNGNGSLSWSLPGNGPVRTEGGPASAIADVNDAYDYLGDTYDFYWNFHGRGSIDNAGMPLIGTVRYCDPDLPASYCPFKNAFWNGDQMVFGDGFASADDVVGHELTHGVTDHESRLFYYMQSGAINESLSDVWGEFIDQWNGKGTDTPAVRWLIGEDLPKSVGVIRNMKNPPAFGDPDSMLSPRYYCKGQDGGGVHRNSGVNNKVAYLLTDGDTLNGYTINPLGMEKVVKIYYEVQTNLLTSGSDYQDLADALYQGCLNLEGSVTTPSDCNEVLKALNAVHMYALPSNCKTIDVPLCSQGAPTDIFFDEMENTASGNWVSGYYSGGDFWYYPQIPNDIGFDATYATSGQYNIWGYNNYYYSDYYIRTASSKSLPASGNIYLQFNHAYEFSYGTIRYGTVVKPYYPDGGVLEYSTDGGFNWNDAESLMVVNGYDGKLNAISYYSNPLGNRKAFVGTSHGYIATKLDLSSLKGQNVQFRFRIGTNDDYYDNYGWFIDDFRIYTCATPYPSTPTVTYPNGGETLYTGQWANITWEAPLNTAYITISYTLDNGVTWKVIEKNFSGSEFQWFVPYQTSNKTKCGVKVTAFNSKGVKVGEDKSDGPFTIEVLRLVSPNGSEIWDSGSLHTIEWVTHGTKSPVITVQLFYTIDGGVSWKPVTTPLTGNPGTYDWTVPTVTADKTKCKVKVVLKDAGGVTLASDLSDAIFTIQPGLR
jgi:Zn-dependent metalloprotease